MTNEACIAIFIVVCIIVFTLTLYLLNKLYSDIEKVGNNQTYILEYNKVTKDELKDYIDNLGRDFDRAFSHIEEDTAYIREDINSIKNETVKEDDGISTSIEAKKLLIINDKTLIKVDPNCTIDDLDGKKFKTENGLILSFGLVELLGNTDPLSSREFALKIFVEGEVKYKNE